MSALPSPAPHRNDWRRTILLFAVTGLVESLAFGHLSAFTPLLLKELHVAPLAVPRWTGILSSLGFVFGLPLLPFWGVWADRYGRKIIIIRSSVFAALIYALTGLSQNVEMVAFARFLGGFVLGNTGVMMAVQADITPRERLGSAVAIISAGSPVGMALGPILGGQIVDHYGVRLLLLLDAGLTALVVLALILLLHEEPRKVNRAQGTRAGAAEALRAIVHTPRVVGLFLAVFLMAYGLSLAQPYVPILIERLYRGRHLASTIGTVMTLAGITMALATPFWGRLGDRHGYLRIMRLCAGVVALTLVGQALAGAVWQVGVWRAAQGLCQGGIGALAMVLLALYAPRDRRSSILTLSLLPQQLAWFLAPLTGSLIAPFALRVTFWGGALALLLGLMASLRLPAPSHEDAVIERLSEKISDDD